MPKNDLLPLALFACGAFVAAHSHAEDHTGIVFEAAEDTGLREILVERRAELAKRAGGPLKSHDWWLWGLGTIDYDRDGDLDLIVSIHGGNGGLIVKNLHAETGELKFADATVELGADGLVPPTDNYPLVWDFDGDGFPDIAGLLDDRPAPCLWNRDGRRFEKAGFSLHPINYPAEIRDLNGDGTADISQIRRGKQVTFHYDASEKTFAKTETPWEFPGLARLPPETRAEIEALRGEKRNRFLKFHFMPDHDLNGDKRPDLVIRGFGSYSGDRVGWALIANESGGFEDRTGSAGLTRQGAPLLAADLDQDGDVDLLTVSGDRSGEFLNDGTGKFTRIPGPLTDFLEKPRPYLHVVFREDLDNDGDLDLAISNRRYGQQKVFENLGGGHFKVVLESRGWDADPLVLRDINGDGLIDVLIGGSGEKENIAIFLNRTAEPGKFCNLHPVMSAPNPHGIGARVEVFRAGDLAKAGSIPRRIEAARVDGSPIHIGLGDETQFDLRVAFPGGLSREFHEISARPDLRIRPDSEP